jgi:PBP1b-binding outer membrane lipoprotein LpoB
MVKMRKVIALSLVAMWLVACSNQGAINSPARPAGAAATKVKPAPDAYDPGDA